jgi:hypothetical protein
MTRPDRADVVADRGATIAWMDPRTAARRDLDLIVVAIVGISRFVDGPALWLVAVLLLGAVVLGVLQIIGEGSPEGVPVESLLLPAVAAAATLGAIRILPLGLALVPGLALVALLVDRTVALEMHVESLDRLPGPDDRSRVRVLALAIAFVAFVGAAELVPQGLVDDSAGPVPLPLGDLAVLTLADAVAAFLIGYRLSALRATSVRGALYGAATYAIVIAIAAGGLRAIALPRLLAPALLTLVLFLWDAISGTAPARRRDPRWLWEIGLLLALGILVVALNIRMT